LIRTVAVLTFWGLGILIAGPLLVLWTAITGNVNLLYRIATTLGITGVRLGGVRIELRGLENIAPGQNYIFMSNHVSNLDPPLLIPSIPGRCSVLVKKELFRIPILGTGMKQASLVPVDRADREAAIESVNAAIEVLRRGLHLVIYPEGTRSSDGRLLPFKKGAFHLAMNSGVPVIPVTLLGTYEAWPKTRFALHPGTATVVFHPPIDPKQFGNYEQLLEAVRGAVDSG
jgi:1-acyl-sn-glycerol-3-phosphate acyltransferase